MSSEYDYEMRCMQCGSRMFSSRGPELIAEKLRCPRCRGSVELAGSEAPPPATPVRGQAPAP
jgi:DNA-directed RNA polymerase subunit RPC12/RpoP